jgi:hypothetical protein
MEAHAAAMAIAPANVDRNSFLLLHPGGDSLLPANRQAGQTDETSVRTNSRAGQFPVTI